MCVWWRGRNVMQTTCIDITSPIKPVKRGSDIKLQSTERCSSLTSVLHATLVLVWYALHGCTPDVGSPQSLSVEPGQYATPM